MFQNLFKFSMLLLLVAGLSYGIHVYFFSGNSLELIKFSYKFNVGITLLFTSTIILASEQLKEQLGFIFVAGGFVKLGILLFLVKTTDLSIEKSLFLHFFVPYAVCVIVEIFYVIKILNRANFSKDR